jgi:pyridoxamine 5'-phosphate oxidase
MTRTDPHASGNAIPESDPFALFDEWFAQAQGSEPNDPNAMALATCTADGFPSVRMVLLKGHGPDGFVFYTNAQSRKGGEIIANPRAALLFHWKSLRRQIRIEGPLAQVTPAEADAYFHSRPFVSQVGSAASDQSRPLPSRETYLARVDELARLNEGRDVPRPDHWTGFRLSPVRMEFWMDRPNRLHERRQFERAAPVADNHGHAWSSTLLYP